MFYVVAYDISDDKRRTKVAKILEDYGDRAQYSVFEMELEQADQLVELRHRLQEVIDPKTDGVRVYFLCHACHEKAAVIGQGRIYQDEEVYIL